MKFSYLFIASMIHFLSVSYGQTGENDSSKKSRQEKWTEDIVYFENEFLAQSKSYHQDSLASSYQVLSELKQEIEELSDTEIILRLARCVVKADNGHTNFFLGRFGKVPVRFFWFADGLYIIKTTDVYSSYLGAKVEKINSTDVRVVRESLKPFLSGNDNWREYLGTNCMASPEILAGIGLSKADSLHLTLSHQGRAAFLSLGIYQEEDKSDLYDPYVNLYPAQTTDAEWKRLLQAKKQVPLYLQHPDKNAFFTFDTENKLAYFNLNSNEMEGKGIKLPKLTGLFLDSLKAMPEYDVVMDLRFFTGGNYLSAAKLARKLPKKLHSDSKIYLITSKMTYSAGVITAARIKYFGADKVIVVGEKVGDNLTFRSEGVYYTLPHSGFYVQDAKYEHDFAEDRFILFTSFWLNIFYGVPAKNLNVDKKIGLRFEDYINRIDPIYTWIIEDSK